MAGASWSDQRGVGQVGEVPVQGDVLGRMPGPPEDSAVYECPVYEPISLSCKLLRDAFTLRAVQHLISKAPTPRISELPRVFS